MWLSKLGLRRYNARKLTVAEGYVSKLWDFTRTSVTQNSLQELQEIWD
ncbi:hypothetical protein Goklo_029238 [Gossypium klotzschianum]|uniref:Uncharacterized protein n=1 Tax=Gossypium klotzschianum TaxID=34286 RepID=A0A7J8WD66_9ROSI|nr:hypothetical protein [Gossypium klotzschianum]